MLVLTRRICETLVIDDDISITVLGIKHRQVRIGIHAPKNIPIYREEIYQRVQAEKTQPTKNNGYLLPKKRKNKLTV